MREYRCLRAIYIMRGALSGHENSPQFPPFANPADVSEIDSSIERKKLTRGKFPSVSPDVAEIGIGLPGNSNLTLERAYADRRGRVQSRHSIREQSRVSRLKVSRTLTMIYGEPYKGARFCRETVAH